MNNLNKREFFLFRWARRLFLGGGNDLARELEKNRNHDNIHNVEEIISPAKQILRNFMDRKLAVFAVCILIAMFLFVLIGPLFTTGYSDSYTEVTQKSMSPGYKFMKIPKALDGDIREISSYGSFTVGLSNAGKVYVWGNTSLGTTGIDMKNIPEDVLNAKIVHIAAGVDHAIAIDESGIVHAWGNNRLGQYGRTEILAENSNVELMPEILLEGGIDVSQIRKVAAGYQCSAILMNDGTLYLWGNRLTYANIDAFVSLTNLVDIDFTLNYIVGLNAQGNSVVTGTRGIYHMYKDNLSTKAIAAKDYLSGRKIVELQASSTGICLLLDDGSLCFTGDFDMNSVPMPEIPDDENIISFGAGTHHFTALSDKGHMYSWGSNQFKQAIAPEAANGASRIFVGAFQNYAVSESGKAQAKWGLSGYLFGTDDRGADIFQRICNGGRRTMTIGAVAVIVSSIIGIIVGCLSGYFGGLVDIILMRVTEFFAAIPFLPFAMTLSAVMSRSALSMDMKIFVIILILGVLSWTGLARLVRGQVLLTREGEYVVAAQAMGVRSGVIAFRHILPNIISVILVTLTLDFATCMLTESTLSYLGFGVQAPMPSWGNMLNGANNATIIKHYWWQWLFTSSFLAATTICINIVGDTLRDVMDPKSSEK